MRAFGNLLMHRFFFGYTGKCIIPYKRKKKIQSFITKKKRREEMPIDDVNEENDYEKIIEMFEEWIKDGSIPEGWDVDIDAKGTQLILRINPKITKAISNQILKNIN